MRAYPLLITSRLYCSPGYRWCRWPTPPSGPLFLTDRKAPARTPTLDVCPVTRKARLSHRRAAELFEELTRLLADPVQRPMTSTVESADTSRALDTV